MKILNSKKAILKIIGILFALISILVCVPQIDGLLTRDYAQISECVVLNDAWDITINEDTYQNVSLSDFRFPVVKKGDVITMQRVLPSNWGLVEGAMRFYVRHNAVRMYIDDAVVYEYGQDRLAAGLTLGSGYQFVKFPNEYQGKRLRIELVMAEDNVITKLDPVRIYEWENAYQNTISVFL